MYRRCWFKIVSRDSLKDNMEIVLISLQKKILTMLSIITMNILPSEI